MFSDSRHFGKDLNDAILDVATEDWYGLWEIFEHVARETRAAPDHKLRDRLRLALGEMIDRGLIEAAVWSYDPPRPVNADYVRDLALDSEFWNSPMDSSGDEQLRLSATDRGRQEYFRRDKK